MRDENMIASLRACQSGMRQRIEIGREEIAALERDVAILDRAIESLSSPEAVTGREARECQVPDCGRHVGDCPHGARP